MALRPLLRLSILRSQPRAQASMRTGLLLSNRGHRFQPFSPSLTGTMQLAPYVRLTLNGYSCHRFDYSVDGELATRWDDIVRRTLHIDAY